MRLSRPRIFMRLRLRVTAVACPSYSCTGATYSYFGCNYTSRAPLAGGWMCGPEPMMAGTAMPS
ncbi:MAG: hypothetical protein ACJAXT_001276 [Paracoccaceae bacterium]|jgi:hypothetical protein